MEFFSNKTYTTKEIDALAAEIKRLKEEKKVLEDSAKNVGKKLEDVIVKFTEAMEEIGKKTWKLEGVGSFTVKEQAYPKLNKDHESVKAFMNWMEEKGEDFYLSHVGINHNTLKRMYREEKEANPEVKIPGLDESYTKKSLSVTKG